MKHIWRNAAVLLALFVADRASPVRAQMGPYQPPISPYINILRGGSSPAINYFNIVQPQMEFNDAINTLQSGQATLGQAVAAQGNLLGTTTGHPVKFGNYSHYYGAAGSMGIGGMRGGGYGMGGMMGMGGMGMGGMGMGGMGMGGMGMGGMGMGGMGMGGMGMGGIGR